MEIGDISGSKPRAILSKPIQKDTNYSLKTHDINGAFADTHADLFLRRKFRTFFYDPLDTKGVPGAQIGTLRKGMQSKRVTNPLNPEYKYLGFYLFHFALSLFSLGEKEEKEKENTKLDIKKKQLTPIQSQNAEKMYYFYKFFYKWFILSPEKIDKITETQKMYFYLKSLNKWFIY